MTSCWEVVKIIKDVVNDQNIYRVKLRGILSLFKKNHLQWIQRILGRKARLERAKSCPRAEQRMRIVGEYERIYTRTHRYALLSPLWFSSYIKKGFYTKKIWRTATRVFKIINSGVTEQTAAGERFTRIKFNKMHRCGS